MVAVAVLAVDVAGALMVGWLAVALVSTCRVDLTWYVDTSKNRNTSIPVRTETQETQKESKKE